jgi:hypothetical protein
MSINIIIYLNSTATIASARYLLLHIQLHIPPRFYTSTAKIIAPRKSPKTSPKTTPKTTPKTAPKAPTKATKLTRSLEDILSEFEELNNIQFCYGVGGKSRVARHVRAASPVYLSSLFS